MENRFTIKDFFLFLLVVVLIISVWVGIKQYDRQWKIIQALQNQMTDQTAEMSKIHRLLEEGVRVTGTAVASPGETTQSQNADPFKYVKQAETRPDFARGDWLVDNFGTKVPTLTPLLSSDLYSTIVQARVQESLLYRDPYTLEYLPLLARNWQIKDNSKEWEAFVEPLRKKGMKDEDIFNDPKLPSALEITFQLRPGVTFSDGVPLTADDVVFTFEWTMNPAVNAPRDRAYMQKIKTVQKINDLEVVFKFREPYFESLDLAGGIAILPKHFYGKYTPETFNKATGLLLGSGPYRLKDPESWRPGDQIEVVRNERYWGEPGTFDRQVWLQVENDTASMTMFKNGELDLFGATPEQYKLLLADKKLMQRCKSYEYDSPLGGYLYIAWNEKRGGKPTRFADKRVRQAMTMIVDRQRIIDELFLGFGTISSGPFWQGSKQVDPNIKPWPYDIPRAKALLKEVGYEDRNGDGILEGPDGQPMRIKLSYPSGNELFSRVVLFLKDAYAKAGIALDLDPQDWSIIIKKLDTRDFEAISLRWSGGIETDIYQMFHSDQIQDGGDDFMSYKNPELDRLINEARSTIDEDKRMKLWQACHRILHEDQPYTFMFSSKALAFLDGRFQNVERSRLGLNYVQRQVMPVPWYVPKDKQKWSR